MPESRAAREHTVAKHGRTSTAFAAVGDHLHCWRPPTADGLPADALVAYATPVGAMVAAGEPVAPLEGLVPVAEAFLAHAASQGKRASFFATEGRLASSPALSRLLIGEQPVWDPRQWPAHVATHRSLREQIRRARAKGVQPQEVSAPRMAEPAVQGAVALLVRRWRATRSMAEMGFLVTIDLTSGAEHRRQFLALQEGRVAALLSLAPVPARSGWLFEHVLRDPDAPNGTLELLVDYAMRTLAAEQVPWATLGLAPLHGPVVGWLRRIRHWSTPLFNFEGLAAFKRKLGPSHWEPMYLAWPVREAGWRALRDGLRAFAGGSLLRFALRTVLRGPAPLLLALEWLLVPWTIALALVPTTPWFPSSGVHAAWVAFDGALLLALRLVRTGQSPSHRARQLVARAATGVALAVSFDAVLTLWQAMWWNMPRTHTLADGLVLLVACAAPLAAAPVLWGAAQRLRTLAVQRPIIFLK
jgi:phosphatidylglycerol lysyltransferase